MQQLDRFALVDGLLDSLAGERFARNALLNTIVDELAAGPNAAARAAQAMLEKMTNGELAAAELLLQIEALRRLIHQGA